MTMLNRDDATQQYMGCLVEVKGQLGFIRDVTVTSGGECKLAFKALDARSNILIDPDPDAVLCPATPYRLGYVQLTDTQVSYLSRSPRRQYQVGWSESNVNGYNTAYLMRMGARLAENLLGRFPTFAEAVKKSQETGGTIAFDRMFAVSDSGGILSYKGNAFARLVDGRPDWNDKNTARYAPVLRPLTEI